MVDRFVPNAENQMVFEEDGVIYDAHLTCTDLKGNNNKYYIM
jgi:hypothetical protein